MTSTPTVFAVRSFRPELRQRVLAELPGVRWHSADEPDAQERLPRADVIVGTPTAQQLQSSAARWIQLSDPFPSPELLRRASERGVAVTKASGALAARLGERTLRILLDDADDSRPYSSSPRSPRGQTIGVVGAGAAGQEVARLCQAIGMTVYVCRRRAESAPGFDRVFPTQELPAMIERVDWLTLVIPLTADTRSLLGDQALRSLRPTARVIVHSDPATIDAAAWNNAQRRQPFRAWIAAGEGSAPLITSAIPIQSRTLPALDLAGDWPRFEALFLANLHRFVRQAPFERAIDPGAGY